MDGCNLKRIFSPVIAKCWVNNFLKPKIVNTDSNGLYVIGCYLFKMCLISIILLNCMNSCEVVFWSVARFYVTAVLLVFWWKWKETDTIQIKRLFGEIQKSWLSLLHSLVFEDALWHKADKLGWNDSGLKVTVRVNKDNSDSRWTAKLSYFSRYYVRSISVCTGSKEANILLKDTFCHLSINPGI